MTVRLDYLEADEVPDRVAAANAALLEAIDSLQESVALVRARFLQIRDFDGDLSTPE